MHERHALYVYMYIYTYICVYLQPAATMHVAIYAHRNVKVFLYSFTVPYKRIQSNYIAIMFMYNLPLLLNNPVFQSHIIMFSFSHFSILALCGHGL